MHRIKLGELLVKNGALTQDQLNHLLALQKKMGRPLGDLAERFYNVSAEVVQSAWVEQYAAIDNDLNDYTPDADCRKLLERRQAWQFHILPVCRDEGELVLATTRRHLVKALNFATRTFNEPVYFVIMDEEALGLELQKYYRVPQAMAAMASKF